jgi:L-lactate permease
MLLALLRLAYFSSPALLVLANVAVGALQGLVPLAVTFGAVLLFEVMTVTGCLQYIMGHVRRMSAGDRIAEVFLIGWGFAYTVSGGECHSVTQCVPDGCKLPLT